MKKMVLLLLLTTLGWGAKMANYNVYNRQDRLDVVLTFYTPYKGKMTQAYEDDAIFLDLDEASISKPILKSLDSPYLTQFALYPKDDLATIIGTKKVEKSINKYKDQKWPEVEKERAIQLSSNIRQLN